MLDRPGPHEFAYLDSDIPPGLTIREWRARRAAARRVPTRRRLFAAATGCVRELARRLRRAAARALARPRMARVRVPGGRHRAPRTATPPSPGATR